MNDFIYTSGRMRLTLDRNNGAVKHLTLGGKPLVLPAKELFTLSFRDENRDLFSLKSSQFGAPTIHDDRLEFSGNQMYPTLKIEIRLRSETDFFYFKPGIDGIPHGIVLDHWDFLPLVVENAGTLLYPYSEGVLVRDPAGFEFKELSFPDRFYWVGAYPGVCQMQFMAHYDQGAGVYFAAYDPRHGTKNIGFGNDGGGHAELHIELFCGAKDPTRFSPDFEYVVGGFEGDWFDAADIYRDWVWKNSPVLQKPSPMPEWVSDSPVAVILPVRGDGEIKAEPNEYFPYKQIMPHVQRLAAAFDSRIMNHLMRWDQHSPWAPPYLWPPLGGAEPMREYVKMIHAEHHLIGLYGSGTSFTVKSRVNAYSIESEYRSGGYERHMTSGPHGETEADICCRLRDGRGMCITEEWTRDIFREQVRMMVEAGVDFIQLLDQNLGGFSLLCYSRDHHHPEIPGEWQTAAMRDFLHELNEMISASGHQTVLGTECAAAEPYVGELPVNDLRTVFAYHYGMPVPLHQFVFHEFVNDFMGNQAGVTNEIRCVECPENILWRTAYSFNAGDLLSVTLRDKGIIDWGAAADWNSPPPDQEQICTLIRNLNRLRRQYPEYLRRGKMVKPCIHVSGGRCVLKMAKREDETVDSFTQSCWIAPDGGTGEFLTNYLPREQVLHCTLPGEMQARSGTRVFTDVFSLRLAPLSAELLKIERR